MANIFQQAPMPLVPKNRFNLSHSVKTSFGLGMLTPVCKIDCIPGDYFKIVPETMLRLAPMISPVMAKINCTVHYFFVPYRLLWPDFEDAITGNGDVVWPFITLGESSSENFSETSVAAYLGLPSDPLTTTQQIKVSPFALAAYRFVYDEYYRDQNLEIAETFVPLVAGTNNLTYGLSSDSNNSPYIRAFKHDYFTSALPFTQKGDAVSMPLTFQQNIPVDFTPDAGSAGMIVKNIDGTTITDADSSGKLTANSTGRLDYLDAFAQAAAIDPNGLWTVDVQSGAVTIETLRSAIALQEFLERDARGGTRYTEKIKAHFGVKSSDARLQRPEYIGGTKSNVVISEVLSTTQNADASLGQMGGHGVTVFGGNDISFFCEEHGVIIGIMSVMPEADYYQGIHRSWFKFDDVNDFCWPAFANLGEQAIQNVEIYAAGSQPFEEWGYQSRYAEYKSIPNMITGAFRGSLDFWHLATKFDSQPLLNNDFIKAISEKFSRIFAVTGEFSEQLYCHHVNRISAVRPLPRFGIPMFGTTSTMGQ